jgi:hypothetical protein
MKLTNFQISVVALTVITVVSVLGYFGYQAALVSKARAIEEKRIEALEIEEQEREATKRTGERWQFLQKLVPWGEDQ